MGQDQLSDQIRENVRIIHSALNSKKTVGWYKTTQLLFVPTVKRTYLTDNFFSVIGIAFWVEMHWTLFCLGVSPRINQICQ